MKTVKPLSAQNVDNVVIGTYSGKSCDADVLNNNAMYLSRELFDKLINSEEYATAIKLGWYIGYLGHPKDPNCMDFRNACIVMREMHMDDNGDVFATFDLLDTPVGKVVKTFIDAGVKFGISIRGAGDVASDGTVDPDSFVFRGYDLVTFPAYSDAIPEYTDVAAATNTQAQQTYKKISSAINNNLSGITSCEALEILQQHLNPVSDEYAALTTREAELADTSDEIDKDEYIDILEQKLKAVTQLYLNQFGANSDLCKKVDTVTSDLMNARYAVTCASKNSSRKVASMHRIFEDQITTISAALDAAKKKNIQLRKANSELKTEITAADSKADKFEHKYNAVVEANKQLKSRNQSITASLETTKESLSKERDKNNLIYNRKIEANTKKLRDNEAKISELEEKVRKTVAEHSKLSEEISNRDSRIAELDASIAASTKMILSYQQAYADMCADIVGIHVDNIEVTASTTAEQLRKMIFGASGNASTNQVQPGLEDFEDVEDFEELDEIVGLDDGIVTL
jgi:septal ring factor EnvC (AmiA/AmiB activator)